jgi:hypothetical protein
MQPLDCSFFPHQTVDVSFLVAIEGGNNLARAKVTKANLKSVHQISDELQALADKLRKGKDESFNKSIGPIRFAPVWAVRYVHVMQQHTIQCNTTQHNTTQHNTTQHNTTQHNTTQRNAMQHNNTIQCIQLHTVVQCTYQLSGCWF